MPLPKNNLLFGFEPKLTDEQRFYVDSIFDYQLTMVNAKSGTGKTSLAVACAKLIGKDLVYIFSPVEEKTMGYRPGSLSEKESNYLKPLTDALLEIDENPMQVMYNEDLLKEPGTRNDMNKAIKEGTVWVYPQSDTFIRGTNIKNKFVIIDEAQNFTKTQLKRVLTRIHDDCKVVMVGHSEQVDLSNPNDSGFRAYIEHFKNEDYVSICKLSVNFRGRLANHADKLI